MNAGQRIRGGEARPSWRGVSALLFAAWVVPAPPAGAADGAPYPEPIRKTVMVDAPLEQVWDAWTTSRGIPTFMGYQAEVDLKPGGAFRVIFDADAAEPLDQGNDGTVVAVDPGKMMSVTWMTPMFMPELRGHSTSLVIYFRSRCDGRRTRVDLVNTGYGWGSRWLEAYEYNRKGWGTVLSRLVHRFQHGPIDWKTFKDAPRGPGDPATRFDYSASLPPGDECGATPGSVR
jgi:uncharacterized protein YndB with AHSA1/START domain